MRDWPIWSLVIACGAAAQLAKLLAYSVARRRLILPMVTRSTGPPSLHASSMSCLVTLMGLRQGWGATETAAALVLAVVVIHDAVRLRGVREEQRLAVHVLVSEVPDARVLRQRVLDYLDPRAHHPAHVGIGVLFGVLFALAFGSPSGYA